MSLYKYINEDVAQFILKNKVIRFTQPIAFNDPYDVYPKLSKIISDEKVKEMFHILTADEKMVEDLLDDSINQTYPTLTPQQKALFSIIPVKDWLKQHIKLRYNSIYEFIESHINYETMRVQMIEKILVIISTYIGVLSLSKISNNLLMWSHYSNCHKGVVLEFDEKHTFLKQFENSYYPHDIEVEYSHIRPEIVIDKFNFTPEESMEMSRKILFIKSYEWLYEKEFRIIRFLQNAKKLDYLDKNGYEIFVFNFPKELLKGIILGSKITEATKEKIFNTILEEKWDLSISQASLNQDNFCIDIKAT